MFDNISIIGDGAMGTVLAMLFCAKKIPTMMWGYDAAQLQQIERERRNVKFLPAHKVPDGLVFESDDRRIMEGAGLIVSAVPCQFIRPVWKRLRGFVPEGVPIVSVAKGIENRTLLRPTEVIADVLDTDRIKAPHNTSRRLAVLSGPTIADELARRLPATACVACADERLAGRLQRVFSTGWFRIYTNNDVVGVELAGAMKNVIAIAAGIIDGTGTGDNAKAALVTRGLAEITRLGVACGASPQTFSGLTGMGDLVTTCISPKGRNRSFGERIGRYGRLSGDGRQRRSKHAGGAVDATGTAYSAGGLSVSSEPGTSNSVIEGIATCRSVMALADRLGVEMPITTAVFAVLFEGRSVHAAIAELMGRRLKAE